MSAGHGGPHGLFLPGTGPLHRVPPQVKLAGTLAVVAAVVATPRQAPWAFGLHALVVAALVALAGLPLGLVLRRLRIELPFLAFAVFLPLVGGDPRVDVAGVSLSRPGLAAAGTIVAKGTLGITASIVLAATTTVPDLLRGLDRLHVPRLVTGIAGFMVRYLGIVLDEARRMHVARQSRGYDPRWLWQAGGVAASAGTLFVRAFERGERVHLAMVSRGYTGTMPDLSWSDAPPTQATRDTPADQGGPGPRAGRAERGIRARRGRATPKSAAWGGAVVVAGVAWAVTVLAWVVT
jgi:cobalt/nickel transport system permease protein